MKKVFFTLLIACFASFGLQAQVNFSNPGFELWSGVGSFQSPQNWNTIGYSGINLCTVTKSTDAHSGDYAIGVSPKQLSAIAASALGLPQMTIPGLITNAQINLSALMSLASTDSSDLNFDSMPAMLNALTSVFTNGLAITQMPSSVNGYAKFSTTNSENEYALVAALAVNQTGDTRTVVGAGYGQIAASTDWTEFSCPIYRFDFINQPSELIFIALCINDDSTATSFGTLYLDDITTQYDASLNNIEQESNIAIFPNPAKSSFKINAPQGSKIIITNAIGQTVLKDDNYSPLSPLSITEKGVYFVQIKCGQKVSTQKLIIK